MDVANADGESVAITGTATITSLGTGFNGCYRELRFAGALTLTHSASLKLPNSANITTEAGDIAGFRCTGSGVWEMTAYSRLDAASVGLGNVNNTSDAAKPVSTAQAAAINAKVTDAIANGVTTVAPSQNAVFDALALKMPLTGGTFTGDVDIDKTTPAFYLRDGTGTMELRVTGGNAILGGAGTLLFLPTTGSTTGQAVLSTTGTLTLAGGIVPGGGKALAKITVSSAAPGVLANGELYLRY